MSASLAAVPLLFHPFFSYFNRNLPPKFPHVPPLFPNFFPAPLFPCHPHFLGTWNASPKGCPPRATQPTLTSFAPLSMAGLPVVWSGWSTTHSRPNRTGHGSALISLSHWPSDGGDLRPSEPRSGDPRLSDPKAGVMGHRQSLEMVNLAFSRLHCTIKALRGLDVVPWLARDLFASSLFQRRV